MADASIAYFEHEYDSLDQCREFIQSEQFEPKEGFMYVCGTLTPIIKT